MNVLTATDMRNWDRFTMEHEPISSINLMERAALACTNWITANVPVTRPIFIVCGRGNNGGDGLAIARQLTEKGYHVDAYALSGKTGTPDFEANAQRWRAIGTLQTIDHPNEIILPDGAVIIDALVGTGLNELLRGLAAEVVNYLNTSGVRIISIDLPSGLSADASSKGQTVVHAETTLTFQAWKPGLLLAENGPFTGKVHVLDIGLHQDFLQQHHSDRQVVDVAMIDSIYRPRQPYTHKGDYGHALLMAGAQGKMGAAVLAARACIRAGSGLLTAAIPACGYIVMQTSVPEAMALTDKGENFLGNPPPGLEKYKVIGIGPGIGTADETRALVQTIILSFQKPMVIDADALNGLAKDQFNLNTLTPGTLITPHPKEFDRLFGEQPHEAARIEKAMAAAREHNIVVILKGAHTLIATPEGPAFFNNTGNAGMAKGGSGDVLTGILTALLAQGYPPNEAALLGVHLHGLAGDEAARLHSPEAMTPSDLTESLGAAFRQLARRKEPDSPKLAPMADPRP